MKKKPLILLLVALLVAAGFGIFWLVKGGRVPKAGGEDVRLFYYRSVPGLRRAEEQDAVIPLRKSFALNEKGLKIELDRIWIGADRAWVLYHIDDGASLIPSGTLILTGAGGETVLYAPAQGEAGQIRADTGLYGYFTMEKVEGDTVNAVQAALYPAVIQERWFKDRVTELDALPISLGANSLKETAEQMILAGEAVEIGGMGTLTPVRIDMGLSRSHIHFAWESAEYGLYGLKGTLGSHRGENLPVDGTLDEDGRVALAAFNYPDTGFTLDIDKAYLAYPQTLTLGIDPKDYRKGSSRQNIEQPVFPPGGPQCILNRIRLTKDWVCLDMTPAGGEEGALSPDPWGGVPGINDVSCINSASGPMKGTLTAGETGITLGIPRAMWDQDLRLWIQVRSPLIAVEPGLHIDLRGE